MIPRTPTPERSIRRDTMVTLVVRRHCNSMRTLNQLAVSLATFAAILLWSSSAGFAKPEYTRRTDKPCEFCHPPNSRELNDAGKYYRDHKHSLEGYKPNPNSKPERAPGKPSK